MPTPFSQRPSLLFIFLLNLVPIWGVIHWGWTPFYVFYLFWLETLVVAFFNSFKIMLCRGDEYDVKLHDSNHRYAGIHINHWSHIGKAIRYFIIRLFIFFFYLIFIVVFIGFFASGQKSGRGTHVLEVMLFRHQAFNYTLLAFVMNQVLQFVFDFYANGNYKRTHPSDFASIFDGRQLVVHVAVVLGGVIGAQDQIFDVKLDKGYVSIIIVSIFCIAKSIYEVVKYNMENDKVDKRLIIPDQAIQ